MGDLPPELQHKSFIRTGDKKTGGPNLRLNRLEMDKPSLTVTGYIFNKFVHPTENRYITPREAAILQDFPDTYKFSGHLGKVQEQVGNAVPVRLGTAIAGSVANYLRTLGVDGTVSIASFFSGPGGFDLGFEAYRSSDIRFDTVYSTDNDEASIGTIRDNRPTWNPERADIQELESSAVTNFVEGKSSIVIGGPPCQPFSIAGKQRGTSDQSGVLYRDFVRLVSDLSPHLVVMENVYGLLQVKAGTVLLDIQDAFNRIGYQILYKQLLAADYGTPQKRKRLILVGIPTQNFGSVPFNFPEPAYAPEGNVLGLPRYVGAGESIIHLPPPGIRGRKERDDCSGGCRSVDFQWWESVLREVVEWPISRPRTASGSQAARSPSSAAQVQWPRGGRESTPSRGCSCKR